MNAAKVAVLAALNHLLPERIKRAIVHTASHTARPFWPVGDLFRARRSWQRGVACRDVQPIV
jgi:hypothetical protein